MQNENNHGENITGAANVVLKEIRRYKKDGGINYGGFSMDLTYDEELGKYTCELHFESRTDIPIWVEEAREGREHSSCEADTVEGLWNEDFDEIFDVVKNYLGDGYPPNMEKIAIKNPTAEQIQAERDDIRIRQKALIRENRKILDEQGENEVERRALVSRLNEIGKRLLEVAKTNSAEPGETDRLFAEQDDAFAELDKLLTADHQLSQIIQAGNDFYDSLERRDRDLIVKLSDLRRNGWRQK